MLCRTLLGPRRTPDGKPDLSGLWQIQPSPWTEIKPLVGNMNDVFAPGDDLMEFSKYAFNILADFPPKQAPIRPEAAAAMRQAKPPGSPCLPGSISFANLIPATIKWIQTPGMIVILHEAGFNFRQVYLDGRKFPQDAEPLWLGYSVGKWEGDALVVDSRGFNDKTALDAMGHPHSEALHLTERYRRRDFGHLDVELTVDDVKMYTRPLRSSTPNSFSRTLTSWKLSARKTKGTSSTWRGSSCRGDLRSSRQAVLAAQRT